MRNCSSIGYLHHSQCFLYLDAENVASQIANDVGTPPVNGLETVSETDESIKMVVDDKVHGVQDMVQGVRDGTSNVTNEQAIMEDFVDGTHVILNI